MNKKFFRISKINVAVIIFLFILLVFGLPYTVTGQPLITFINFKPYYTYTTDLSIQGGELSSDDLKKLCRFQWVEKLYLWPMQINDISFLNSMDNLEELTIGGLPCEIEDWTPINNCSNLTSVFAWNVGLTNLKPFENLTQLKRLELQENNISDITGIDKMQSLESISIWGNDLKTITPISGASNLKHVKILSTSINDISDMSSLEKLESLILNGCTNVTDVSSLKDCDSLRYLDISNTAVKDYSSLSLNPNLNIETASAYSEFSNIIE